MTDQTTADRPEVDDPHVLALAKARQQMAYENPFNAGFNPPWDGLSEQEQRLSLLDARNYLRAALKAGLVPAAAPAAAEPSADPTTLRDRIAEALYAHDHPNHLVPLNETGMGPAYRESADAVLSVLPAPVDRAAVLNEAADAVASHPGPIPYRPQLDEDGGFWWDTRDRDAVVALLRRMAVEAQPTQPQQDEAQHAPGTAILCPDCRIKGHAVCTAAGAQQDGATS